jgi:hypothetical protein
MTQLASDYGRYGYRRVTALLRGEGRLNTNLNTGTYRGGRSNLLGDLHMANQFTPAPEQQPIRRLVARFIQPTLKIFGQGRLIGLHEKLHDERVVACVANRDLSIVPQAAKTRWAGFSGIEGRMDWARQIVACLASVAERIFILRDKLF